MTPMISKHLEQKEAFLKVQSVGFIVNIIEKVSLGVLSFFVLKYYLAVCEI